LAGVLGLTAGTGAFHGGEEPQPPPAAAPAEPATAARPEPHADAEGFPLPAEALARVGSVRLRHGRTARRLEYSPDGRLLVSSGLFGRSRLWEASTGKLVREISVPAGRDMQDGFFSADGKTVLLLDGETCRWFDVRTGKEVRHFDVKFPKADHAAYFAPGGELLAVLDKRPGKDLVVYDLASGTERFRKAADRAWYWPLDFSPDGKTLAVAEWEGKAPWAPFRVRLLDAKDGRDLGGFDAGHSFADLRFSPDGKTLLANDRKKTVFLWDVPGGKPSRRFEVGVNSLLTADFTADGKSVVVGSQDLDTLQIDAATGKEVRRFRTGIGAYSVAFTPDGKTMAAARSDGAISQWDLASGRRLAPSADVGGRPLRFSADGKLVWVAGEDLTGVDWQTGREVRRVRLPREGAVAALALSADGARIAGANTARKLTVWDGASGEELRALADTNSRWNMRAFSPDNKTLYACEPGEPIRAWNLNTGNELPEFRTGFTLAFALVPSPDGRWLAAADHPNVAGGSRPEVLLWDLPAGREPRQLLPRPEAGRVTSLAFSPDGSRLAAVAEKRRPDGGWGGSVIFWDVRTGEEKFSLTGLANGLTVVRFSPDGRLLAAGGHEGTVGLWEVATGQLRHRFIGHENSVYQLFFSPDGKLLASHSADAATLVWDIEARQGKRPPPGPLSGEEEAALWNALNDADAPAAFAAVRRLLARPGPAVELLRQHLPPAPAVGDKTVRDLLRDLDADDFAVREKAATDLAAVADRAEPALRKALAEKVSVETRRQIEHALEMVVPAASERRRELRAVEVLERLGTAEARELLASLAGGAKESFLTREARAAVGRLKGR
jgi:WD40 repeat protein